MLVTAYLLVINLVLFFVMYADKRRAIRHKRRVPERTLFLLAALGGSLGGIVAMSVFRHKTKHAQFLIGFPALLILQLAILIFLYVKGFLPLCGLS